MAENQSVCEWLEIKLDSLSSEDRVSLITEIMETISAQDLRRIRDTAEDIRQGKLSTAKTAFIEEMRRKSEELGLSLDEVVAMATAQKSPRQPKPSRVKYRSPNNETWSGRGRVPVWIREYEDSGGNREDFRIAEDGEGE